MRVGSLAMTFHALGLIDFITTITNNSLPGSHIRGSQQINGI